MPPPSLVVVRTAWNVQFYKGPNAKCPGSPSHAVSVIANAAIDSMKTDEYDYVPVKLYL